MFRFSHLISAEINIPIDTTKIEGFHVTSYQANFASPRPRDRHVGFLSPQSGIGKHNKMPQNFSFSLYPNTKLQLSDKNISLHTWVKFEILLWRESKITVRFPYAVQKGNQGAGQTSCAYKYVPRGANPLHVGRLISGQNVTQKERCEFQMKLLNVSVYHVY